MKFHIAIPVVAICVGSAGCVAISPADLPDASVCAILEEPEQYVGRSVIVSGWIFVHHRGTSIFAEPGCSVRTLTIAPTTDPVPGRAALRDALGLNWDESSRGEVLVRIRGTIQPSSRPQYSRIELIPTEYLEVTGTAFRAD